MPEVHCQLPAVRWWRHWPRLLLLCAAGLCGAARVEAGDPGLIPPGAQLLQILHERGLNVDGPDVDAAANKAILGVADPFCYWITNGQSEIADLTNAATSQLWPMGLRYCRIPHLDDAAAAMIASQLQAWAAEPAAGVILDLRGAGGNSPEAVDQLAGLYRPATTSLYALVDGHGRVLDERATLPLPAHLMTNPPTPCAILVDHRTRGGAEILAAVLVGARGVLIMGEATAGDGGLREPIAIDSNRTLVVATRWARPGGGPMLREHPLVPTLTPSTVTPSRQRAEPGLDESLDGSSHARERTAAFEALALHVGGDALLSRAADTLLALQALGAPTGAPSAADSPTPAPPEEK